jgi:hypothetical protein
MEVTIINKIAQKKEADHINDERCGRNEDE